MTALGRYELLRPLARGGMAEVFLARRRVGGVEKRLVVKRLRRDHHRDPRFLEMFVREAQLSMSLVQQNIVPVFDFGRIGDDVFIAMEYIDGQDLGSTLARARERGTRMAPLLAAFVAAECCQALDHAHRRRVPVIHRDVTPRNVLVSWEGEVKLADFGIAAVVGDPTGTTFGTPGYMAPEQANGLPCDARVDLYGLGIVLWEALSGDRVRPASDRLAAMAAARSGELPPISDELPAALAEVIRRATARSPEDRFASARDMADALDMFLVAERARTGAGTPARQLATWLRELWGDTRDEAGEQLAEAEAAGAIVTFLDDGADHVLGTHTARSAAVTAGEEPAVKVEPAPPPAVVEDKQIAAPATPPRRRWTLAILAIALLVGAALIVRGAQRRATTATPDAATIVVDASIDAGIDAGIDAPSDAPVDAPIDALIDAPIDAAIPAPVDAAIVVRPRRVDAGVVAPVAELRPITIGAIPWAHFTVDSDPKQYETPATLRLSVGPHRVTFTNPQLGVSRTVTVVVPAEGDARHVEKMR